MKISAQIKVMHFKGRKLILCGNINRKRKSLCFHFQEKNRPVLMAMSLSSTSVDALMWIPSVLGLSEGAIILTPEAETCLQLVKARCIC